MTAANENGGAGATDGPAEARAPFTLNDFMPYRIVALGHAMSEAFGAAYRREGVTIPEWRVLAVVAEAPPIAARDVVARTPLDKMAVSRAVGSLEQKGLVERSHNDDDRRVVLLQLTEKGLGTFQRIAAIGLEREEKYLSMLTKDERAVLSVCLAKLYAQFPLSAEPTDETEAVG